MATTTLQAESAPANAIVAAYLAARGNEQKLNAENDGIENFDTRMAQFAESGGRDYVMSWLPHDSEHAALIALLTAERLQNLIEGFSSRDEAGRQVVTFGIEELYEVKQIKDALLNLWQLLDAGPARKLLPLALDMGLVDKTGKPRA